MVVAIQEGVEKALADAGIENVASTSLKNSLIRYFEDEENKQSFDIYAISFGRDNTEEDAIMIAKALVKVIKG